eukprot:6143918-Prymnesium_polylepis.1
MATSAMTKEEVEKFLGSVDLRTPLEEGLNAAVSYLATNPASFFSNFFYAKELLHKFGCALREACCTRSDTSCWRPWRPCVSAAGARRASLQLSAAAGPRKGRAHKNSGTSERTRPLAHLAADCALTSGRYATATRAADWRAT